MNPAAFLLAVTLLQADTTSPGTPPGATPDTLPRGRSALDSIPDDTCADPEVEEILRLALAEGEAAYEGIEIYEGVMSERVYAGMGGWRLRRERGVFTLERIARIR